MIPLTFKMFLQILGYKLMMLLYTVCKKQIKLLAEVSAVWLVINERPITLLFVLYVGLKEYCLLYLNW